MRGMWLDNWYWDGGGRKWKNWWGRHRWWFWRSRERCRMTGVLSMKELLEKKFGDNWVSPKKVVKIEGLGV